MGINVSCATKANNNNNNEWDYELVGPNSPRYWAQSCAKQQSPINLQLSQLCQLNCATVGNPLEFVNYDSLLNGVLRNTGRHSNIKILSINRKKCQNFS